MRHGLLFMFLLLSAVVGRRRASQAVGGAARG